MNRPLWRISLRGIGPGSVIQAGVFVDRPRLVTMGAGCLVARGAVLLCESHAGVLVLGDQVEINSFVRLDHTGGIEIGSGTVISAGAVVYTHDHGHDPRAPSKPTPLQIGPRAWIGGYAMVLPGVGTIGEQAIVAAGAVVTKPVPPFTIVAGNPARTIGSTSSLGEMDLAATAARSR